MILTGADYLRWVQRSLNRILNVELVVNGEDSPSYRALVSTFQVGAGLPATTKVDETTQNALIRSNEATDAYMRWVQSALNLTGAIPPLSIDGRKDKSTTTVIKGFQASNGLKDDGFVGAKTETVLIKVTGTRPPGDVPEPKAPTARKTSKEKRLASRLLTVVPLIEADPDPVKSKELRCIVRKITDRIVDGKALDDRYTRVPPAAHHGSEIKPSFVRELIDRYLEKPSDDEFVQGLSTLRRELLEPPIIISRKVGPLLMDLTSDPISGKTRADAISQMEEFPAIVQFFARARDNRSVYNCFLPHMLRLFEKIATIMEL